MPKDPSDEVKLSTGITGGGLARPPEGGQLYAPAPDVVLLAAEDVAGESAFAMDEGLRDPGLQASALSGEDAATPDAAATTPPHRRSRSPIIAVAFVLLAIAAAAIWYFLLN